MTTVTPEVPARLPRLVHAAAMLAGLGPEAAAWAEPERPAARRADRSCVDAGSEWLLSVRAPGPRALRLGVRRGEARGPGARWTQHVHARGRAPERAAVSLFGADDPGVYAAVRAAAIDAGVEGEFLRDHAAVGPYGRLFRLSESSGAVEVGWLLDRHTDPATALARLGLRDAWPAARDELGALFGRPLTPASGPWTVTRLLAGPTDGVRLATAAWARQVEDAGKVDRLGAAVERHGGDGRYAEGVHRMLRAAAPRPGARIGRAAELELRDGAAVGLECFLALPAPHLGRPIEAGVATTTRSPER
jgi:hypothetical protein